MFFVTSSFVCLLLLCYSYFMLISNFAYLQADAWILFLKALFYLYWHWDTIRKLDTKNIMNSFITLFICANNNTSQSGQESLGHAPAVLHILAVLLNFLFNVLVQWGWISCRPIAHSSIVSFFPLISHSQKCKIEFCIKYICPCVYCFLTSTLLHGVINE